jgi:hypothetical protein
MVAYTAALVSAIPRDLFWLHGQILLDAFRPVARYFGSQHTFSITNNLGIGVKFYFGQQHTSEVRLSRCKYDGPLERRSGDYLLDAGE